MSDNDYDMEYAKQLCTVCDPDNDIDCGWEKRNDRFEREYNKPVNYEKREVYMPIDMNTYFIAYSAESSPKAEHTVAITALSMDAALTKWALQFSDLYVHARSIFKYQPYSAITKVYKVNLVPVIEWVKEYKVQY